MSKVLTAGSGVSWCGATTHLLLRSILVIGAGIGVEPIMAETLFTPPRAAPARDGNIAIQAELDLARKIGTVEAYDLFIARHPTHRLAQAARGERDRLPGQRPR